MSETRETPQTILQRKGREPIAALTAYDFPMAKLLDAAGVPLLLVGDSLGMVVLGYPDTTLVTLEEMEHHVRAVARARPRGLVAADLPFETYETPQQAVESAKRLADAGAEAVKAEGGQAILPQLGKGETVIISAHGNSLRALVKHLSAISDDEITGLEIPTGQPIVYEFEGTKVSGERYYLKDS